MRIASANEILCYDHVEQCNYDAITQHLNRKFPCRETEISQLVAVLSQKIYGPTPLIVYGLPATGKTSIVQDALSQLKTRHIVIACAECITGRHLLEKTLVACHSIVTSSSAGCDKLSRHMRCENLAAFSAQLQRLFEHYDAGFTIVLDGIDHQREITSTFVAGLLRISEYMPNLSFVLTATDPNFMTLHGLPPLHIHFASYSQREILSIVSREVPGCLVEEGLANENDAFELWHNFCSAVWEAEAKFVATDLVKYRAVVAEMWQRFVQPIRSGEIAIKQFSRLMVANRSLFQSEISLRKHIVQQDVNPNKQNDVQENDYFENLSYYSKYILCAAYLASYNPPRTDVIYFMRTSDKKRRRKRLGLKKGEAGPFKARKVSRKLLSPSPFSVERLIGIFHAILPQDIKPTVDIFAQIATLTSLKLLTRTSLGIDPLDSSTKWKSNVTWEYVNKLGRGVGLELSDYAFED